MKLTKKVALGVTLVAMLGGGLAGCGKQKATPHRTRSQQKAVKPKSANQDTPDETAGAMNGLINDPKTGKNLSFWTTEPKVPYTYVFKKPETVKKHEDHFNPNTDVDKIVHARYNPKPEMQKDWKSIHQQIVKQGLDASTPLKIQFLYYTDTVDGKDNRLYRVFTAKTNSSSLHDSHMQVVRKFNRSQSFDPVNQN